MRERRHFILRCILCAWALTSGAGEARERPPSTTAPTPPAISPAASSQAPVEGYLTPGTLPDARDILPPPPTPGSPGEAFDRAVFFATRKLKGTPRWELATRDAVYTPPAFLEDFSCALGVQLSATNAPSLVRVLTRIGPDLSAFVNLAKAHHQHPRPFVGTDQPICEAEREVVAKSWSYPSGHATMSWTLGLLLAELAPDAATPILVRARSLGESRVVCGVHTVSDVEAGRTCGSMLVAALHSSEAFKADLERARRELATARETPRALTPEAARCALEKVAARPPWAEPSSK